MSRLGADPDFRRLWAGQSISVFGTLVTRTALPFTALFVLHAGPLDVAFLAAADLVAGVVFGLVAGAWVDRLPRRPVMIVADLGRAALLASVPAMAALGVLRLESLYVVAFLTGALTVWFDVAYHAHLPFLVPARDLVEANSRLAASASVAEVGAFGIGGWLVQWLSAPRALVVDAVSFLVSAAAIAAIRKPEPPPAPAAGRVGLAREIRAGFGALAGDPRLLAIATSEVAAGFAMRLFGTLILVFATRELGLAAGVQGMIYAVGGVTSLTGALLAGPVARAFGVGRALVVGLGVAAAGALLVPLAHGAGAAAIALMVAQQVVSDGAITMYQIHQASLLQSLSPDGARGRIQGAVRFATMAAMLLGTLAAGILGDKVGLRPTLVAGALALGLAAVPLLAPTVLGLARIPDAGTGPA